MPNERWDDFALDREFENIKNFQQAIATLPNQMTKLAAAVESNTHRIDSHHGWIEAVEARTEKRLTEVKELCERIGADLRDDAKERRKGWVSIVVAIISAGAIVAAAVISSS